MNSIVVRSAPFLLLLATAALLASCGSSSCSRACKKIDKCVGDSGVDVTCPLSAKCDTVEKCKAQCIDDATCDAILGKDPQGQQALAECLAKCDSTSQSDGMVPQDLGTIEQGPPPDQTLPEDQIVLPDFPPSPDVMPLPDTISSPAVGKFCNDLLLSDQKFTADLKVGSGSSQVTFSAYSGECSPVVGVTCQTIPTGSNLAIEVTDGTQTLMTGNITQSINAGEEWLFILTVDSTTQQATLQGGPFDPQYQCKSTDPFNP